ncbi:MAG: tRNA (N6-isopentenyl adenosine(37)-C2)-methylthiotransferase MiaB [Thermoleophilia bacterium]|nr:tRNA (N6-isopentenyl adenosine(37)-C2)-methylthiotransferase MiaB [Thermoleophilia bacterium]
MNSRRYHLTTFGCQMNEHDSERIRGVLEESGWLAVDDAELADLLIFNTCSVRESAENRLLGRLGEARRLKNERPERLVALAGCFAQSRQAEIFDELPFLDIAFGPRNIGDLPALVDAAESSAAPVSSFEDTLAHSGELPSRRLDRYRAWVQVMTGCTNFCSYCIVPSVRGPERSRRPADIIDEVKRLVLDGVVEVTLLGQNVNSYGPEISFASLLTDLDAIDGLRRIRFMTSHPKDLSPELIEAIRDLPSVCEHIHLPVQSGSNRVLDRMNRGYTREHYLGLIASLKERVPGIAITTDMIIGFPGEKEEDFYRTMTLAGECRFDGAFTFLYSPRSGTEAAGLTGQIPSGTMKRRMGELIGLTQQTALANNELLLGTAVEVLIEGPSRQGGGQWRGRTRTNKVVNFSAAETGDPPEAGAFAQVNIDSVTSTTLRATQASGHD